MIAVDHTLKDLAKQLGRIQSQVPFATSRALNVTARAVQAFELGTELPGHLKLRGTWARPGTRFGVNVNFARKDNLKSEVFSRAPWLDLQERGGVKTPKKKLLIMPVTGGARPSELAPFTKRLKPGPSNPRVIFIAKKHGFFMRLGGKRNPRLKLLWSFTRKDARVKKRISFEERGAKMGVEMLPGQFLKTYAAALRNGR